jgi:hypothetical protein
MALGSGIRDPRSGIQKKPIPAPDPGSGSATLIIYIKGFSEKAINQIFQISVKIARWRMENLSP